MDVVLVLIGAGDSQHHVLFLRFRPVDSLGPEPGDSGENLHTHGHQVVGVAGTADVVVDTEGDGAVPVDLLEGDFPLVMALLSVHGHHGVESRAVCKSQLAGVLYGPFQMVVTVDQKLPGYGGIGGSQVEGEAVGLGVPVGGAAVLFAGESLGADIQSLVLAGIGLLQLKDIKADTLLGRGIPLDGDIAVFPYRPSRPLSCSPRRTCQSRRPPPLSEQPFPWEEALRNYGLCRSDRKHIFLW